MEPLVVGIMLSCIGLLLITAKLMSYIKCTVPVNATVVKLEREYTHFRSVKHTHYRPVVKYVVDGRAYSEKAFFRTRIKAKYPIDSQMISYFNPKNPEQIRFPGHLFPLPMGLVFLLAGAVLIICYNI